MTTSQSNPRSYLRLLWRWKFLFAVFVIAAPAIAYVITSREPKVYQSTALLQENPLPVDNTVLSASGGGSAGGGVPNAVALGGEARIIETPVVAKLAARYLKNAPPNPDTLIKYVTAAPDTKDGFITVQATAHRPQRAADIANAFGRAVVTLRTTQATTDLQTTIDRLDIQIEHLSAKAATERSQLAAEVDQLRSVKAAQVNNAQILQAAVPAGAATSPHVKNSVFLGLIAGLMLGFGVVFVAEAADRRVRHPEDVEALTELPLLSVVPKSAFLAGTTTTQLADEPFHRLRSALMYFNVDKPLSTVLIASPMKGDGKTTVATGLAVAAAQAGRQVILLDADLRRPNAARRLGLNGESAAPGIGLAAVLTGQSALRESLIDLPLRDPHAGSPTFDALIGSLRLLPAGETPPNPSELLASQRMRDLIDELLEISDLVVIDSNPLLSVSDSLPLLDVVSGIVVVARLGSTTKEAIRRFQKTVANTNATVLGVVATGAARGRGGDEYGRGSAYARSADDNGSGSGNGRGRLLRVPGVGAAKPPSR